MNDYKNKNLLNALCLHVNDNIIITLKNLNSGVVLNEYGITMEAPALSGQKIARFDIKKMIKYLKKVFGIMVYIHLTKQDV